MTSRRESLRVIASLCDVIGPEDGFDPRHSRCGSSRKKATTKTQQLCKQVVDALHLAFAALGDDDLNELQIERVEPAPDASRLLVVVAPANPRCDITEVRALEALTRAERLLKSAVTDAIHRKRTPGLTFGFAPHSTRENTNDGRLGEAP